MNPVKTFFYAWREMLTGKGMPEAQAIERKEPLEPWPTRPESVELCAECWTKLTGNINTMGQVEVTAKNPSWILPDVDAPPPPTCKEPRGPNHRSNDTACGKCSHYRSEAQSANVPHCSLADICLRGFATTGKTVLCRDKNTDGTCPDFEQRTPQFNYLTGEWTA